MGPARGLVLRIDGAAVPTEVLYRSIGGVRLVLLASLLPGSKAVGVDRVTKGRIYRGLEELWRLPEEE